MKARATGPKRRCIDRSGRKEASKEKNNRKPAYPTTIIRKNEFMRRTCIPGWLKTRVTKEKEREIEQDRVLEERGKRERVKILKLSLCLCCVRRSQETMTPAVAFYFFSKMPFPRLLSIINNNSLF